MISVEKAEKLVLAQAKSFGREKIPLSESLGRVLAEDIFADRPYPPFNRATMDGIAISFDAFKNGIKAFQITSTVAAGQKPYELKNTHECVQIMTGAALPNSCDTVIPIEEIKIKKDIATINPISVKKGQFIHPKGVDKKKGEVVLQKGTLINPTVIPVLASVGAAEVTVAGLPKVAVITTGDELVEVDKKPNPYQIRRSNGYAIESLLSEFKIQVDKYHLQDDSELIKRTLQRYFKMYDILILSGGVSKGEFDYVYRVLEELTVKKLFHGIAQKPGKPMWFGKHEKGAVVFALPGNPVSSFLCMRRYVIPFIEKSLRIKKHSYISNAILKKDTFSIPDLTLFTQGILSTENGRLFVEPLPHNGSGDFISLVGADCFIELPSQASVHKKGNTYTVWPIKSLQ